ncbi:MAG: hypothetical protein IJQ39_05725 [Thermoguttaceae bacterium]|nr:hypothetical protein [Thermoguttaceae bacterium]
MAKKKSVFRVRFSENDGLFTLNEKNGVWEYKCSTGEKLVVWLDPNIKDGCVYLNFILQDADGNQISKEDNDIKITNAIMFPPVMPAPLCFAPVRWHSYWQLPFGSWCSFYPPKLVMYFPVMIAFNENSFGINHLFIPERPELLFRQKCGVPPKVRSIIEQGKERYNEYLEENEDMEQKSIECIQQTNKEWEEWERQQAEDWERRQTEKRKRQQKEEQDDKEESGE